MKSYGPFHIELAYPFAMKFGSDNFLKMRKILHHLIDVANGKKEYDLQYLQAATGLNSLVVVDICRWLIEMEAVDLEINWVKSE